MQQQYDIGKRLREVMAERGVTISQLAEMTDVSEDTIKAIRSGKTKSPGIQLMISIADALGCTMDGFLHRRSLTDEELYLLQKYRTLNIHGKRMVMLMADSEDHMQSGCVLRQNAQDSVYFLNSHACFQFRLLNTRDRIYRDTRRLFSKGRLLSEAHDQYAPSYLY